MGVELLTGIRGLTVYLTHPNSEYRMPYHGSETTGDKLRGREGKSPDRRLRSPIHAQCSEGCGGTKTARMLA